MFRPFRHCRAYALATLFVINLFPAVAFAISSEATVTVTSRVCLPETATATITSPVAGEVFTESVITVSGTTNEVSVPIEVERNGISAGTTLAEPDGNWSMPVTLTPGANSLVAISCQSSPAVLVTYQPPQPTPSPPDPPPTVAPGGPSAGPEQPTSEPDQTAGPSASPGADKSGGAPPAESNELASFFLTTTRGLVEGAAEQDVTVDAIIQGGAPPYQATLAWGDGTTDQRTITTRSKQNFTHRFVAGDFKPLLQMTDADGRQSSLAYVVRISQAPCAHLGCATTREPRNPDNLLKLLLIEAALTITVFAGWEAIHQHHLLADAGCPGGKA